MTAELINGTALAASIRQGLRAEVAEMIAAGLPQPGLGVILVGDDPASAVYVRHKTADCTEIGLHSVQLTLPADATQEDVLAAVRQLNADPAVHALLVQSPIPDGLDFAAVVEAIDPRKDADGLHPYNVGMLAKGTPTVAPCTPAGVMEALRHAGIPTRGADVVIVGRSNIVGRPLAQLMILADATVTVCHTRTRNLQEVTRRADIVVAAAGRAGMITGDMIRPGAAVVDVGINRAPATEPGGRDRLVGDVDRASVEPVAGYLTPVPGGIGPLTRAMLLVNTVRAARAAG